MYICLAGALPGSVWYTRLDSRRRRKDAEEGEKEATVVLEYTGPEKIKYGIELALKDSPLIDTVEFI